MKERHTNWPNNNTLGRQIKKVPSGNSVYAIENRSSYPCLDSLNLALAERYFSFKLLLLLLVLQWQLRVL